MPMRPEKVDTVQIVRRFYRSWWKRPFWLLGALVLAVAAGRIALTPLLIKHVRQELDRRTGKGAVTFQDLDVFMYPPTFVFKAVAVRGSHSTGQALLIERAEVHAPSWRALRKPSPLLRVYLVRPDLRLVSGAPELEGIIRALPAARIEVASVSGGRITNGSALDNRPVVDRITGEIEGLASGAEVGRKKWQFWGDGHLLTVDPFHVVIGGEPGGAWRASLTGREANLPVDSTGPPPAVDFDGRASGVGARVRAAVHAQWSMEQAPVALSQEKSRALDERWPATDLRLVDVRVSVAADGQAVDAVIDDATALAQGQDWPTRTVGLLVGMVRLGNRAVVDGVADAPGVASLNHPPVLGEETDAASYDSH